MRRGPARALTVALLVAGGAASATACDVELRLGARDETLPTGTWGGEGAAVVVGRTRVHVHVGCTTGDFDAPVRLSPTGRFAEDGRYLLRAFPVAVGPHVPATFLGEVHGDVMTLEVAVDDTVARRLVLLGPVTARLGEEPRLGQCPICRAAPVARAAQGFRFPVAAR